MHLWYWYSVCGLPCEYFVSPVHSHHHTLRAGLSYRLLDMSHLSLVLTSHQVSYNTKPIEHRLMYQSGIRHRRKVYQTFKSTLNKALVQNDCVCCFNSLDWMQNIWYIHLRPCVTFALVPLEPDDICWKVKYIMGNVVCYRSSILVFQTMADDLSEVSEVEAVYSRVSLRKTTMKITMKKTQTQTMFLLTWDSVGKRHAWGGGKRGISVCLVYFFFF